MSHLIYLAAITDVQPPHFADFSGAGSEAIAQLAPSTLDVIRLELRFVLAQGSSQSADAADDD